jgi:tetratricopeptide (TPR) repeat protein
MERGLVYSKLRQFEKAVDDFSEVMNLDPKFPTAAFYRGVAYKNLRQFDKGIADFTRAIELDPKLWQAWFNRGLMYQYVRRFEDAVMDFTKVIDLQPKKADAWRERGLACMRLGFWDKARSDLSQAVELIPNSAFFQNELAWLLATCPDFKFQDPKRAVELATKAVKLTPRQANRWNTLGVAQYRAQNWTEAIAALNQSMELKQGRPSLYDMLFLAMAHGKLAKTEEARKWYDQAIQYLESHQKDLEKDRYGWQELERFRAEAKALLEVKKK